MKKKLLMIAMLLSPLAIQANVELPETVSTQSLIASIAKSNLTEEEKSALIDSFVESRVQTKSQAVLNDRGDHRYSRHGNRHNNTEYSAHSNKEYCPNQWWH